MQDERREKSYLLSVTLTIFPCSGAVQAWEELRSFLPRLSTVRSRSRPGHEPFFRIFTNFYEFKLIFSWVFHLPPKRLRFVTFEVCGAKGHLSETLNGHHVNYSTRSTIALDYYYVPQRNNHRDKS